MRAFPTCLVLCSLFGCAMGESPATRFTLTDSAGIELAVSTAPQWEDDTGWRLAPEPALQIGALDGPEEYLLDRVGDVLPLNDGHILIVNHGTRQIREYEAAGAYVRAIGRSGEGPGEFQGIASVVVRGDSLFVFDNRLQRVTHFAAGGAVRGTTQLDPDAAAWGMRTYRLKDVTAAGLVLMSRGGFLGFINRAGMRRDSVPTLLYNRDGTVADTIAEFGASDVFERVQQMVGSPLFGVESSGVARNDTIYMTDGGSMEVRMYVRGAGWRRVVRIAEQPIVVTDEHADAAIAYELERAPDAPQQWREELELVPHRPTMPRISGMLLDDESKLWVEEYRARNDTTSHTSYVFAPDGRWLGTIDMPPNFELRAVSRVRAYGVWRDPATDVQYVRVYDVVR